MTFIDALRIVILVGVLQKFSNLFRCLVSVHKWHATVSKDKRIPFNLIFFNSLANKLYSLLSVVTNVYVTEFILHSKHSHETLNSINIKHFVVYDQYSLVAGLEFVFGSEFFNVEPLSWGDIFFNVENLPRIFKAMNALLIFCLQIGFVQIKWKYKPTSFSELWLHYYFTIELLNNIFTDKES